VQWVRPEPEDLWQAVEAYLAVAYVGEPPPPVLERLAQLRAASPAALYDCEAFERGEGRCALRLGNRFYPHMKLVVEAAPGGRFVFLADTHDRHFLDMVDSSDPRLAELLARNQEIARAIDDAWSARGLPTMRGNLREQIARRRALRP
jgi:hypothetical protein